MKSNSTDEIIKLMRENDIDAILYGVKSSLPILNMNSVLFGARYKITSPEFIDVLKSQFRKSEIKFFGVPFDDIVTAALDVLGVEKYNGDDEFILNLISSQFQIF